ncbi:MAG: DUF1801 domain-containing protein [Anaerolineales bacterium]
MRLTSSEFSKIFERYPEEIQDICWGVRDIVFEVVPTAWERGKMGGVAFYLTEHSSPLKGMICHMTAEHDQVKIGFIFGAFMDDPLGLLQGEQKAKRYLVLDDFESVPWEGVKELVRSAAAVDPTTFY